MTARKPWTPQENTAIVRLFGCSNGASPDIRGGGVISGHIETVAGAAVAVFELVVTLAVVIAPVAFFALTWASV